MPQGHLEPRPLVVPDQASPPLRLVVAADGAAEAAVGVGVTSDEGAEAREFDRQATGAAPRAGAGVGAARLLGRKQQPGHGVGDGVAERERVGLLDAADRRPEFCPPARQEAGHVQLAPRDCVWDVGEGGGCLEGQQPRCVGVSGREVASPRLGGLYPSRIGPAFPSERPRATCSHPCNTAPLRPHRDPPQASPCTRTARTSRAATQAERSASGRGAAAAGRARRARRSPVLRRLGLEQRQLVALGQRLEHARRLGPVAAVGPEHFLEPGEQTARGRGAGGGRAISGAHVDGEGLVPRLAHLRGERAPPDELVQRQLALGHRTRQRGGLDRKVDGPDGLVSLLRVFLPTVSEEARRVGKKVGREVGANVLACGGNGLVAHLVRVRPHVRNERARLAADGHTLVQLLRQPHDHADRHAQPRRRVQLHRRRVVRRGRRQPAGGAADGGHAPRRPAQHGRLRLRRRRRRREAQLPQPLATQLGRLGREGGGRIPWLAKGEREPPVLVRSKAEHFLLTLDDEPECHRLHAPGRPASGQLAPEDWRQGKADKVVDRLPRLLRLDE
eukprot:scaffold8048_cov103-Isochrysis_galbana.AAC.3